MRCKVGDICVIIGGLPENVGRLLRVDGVYYSGWWLCEALQTVMTIEGVEVHAGEKVVSTDDILRPLRDGPGTDETLEWVGRPETAPANPLLTPDTSGA